MDLDDAIKWWDCRTKNGKQVRRDQLVRKLKANYYEGVNYTLHIFVERVKGCITTPDKYFLSIECFKMMGMQVSGERGHEIRRYFLNCEAELKRRLQEDEKQRHWKVIKACVFARVRAVAAYPDTRFCIS